MKYTTDIVIYDLPDPFEDRQSIWKAVKSILGPSIGADAPDVLPQELSWDWDFNRQSDRMSCTVYGTKDELVDIRKRIRRLSRGKIRFQFEWWPVAQTMGQPHPCRAPGG